MPSLALHRSPARLLAAAVAALALASPLAALAGPLPSALTVRATAAPDTASSTAATGGGIQTSSFGSTVNGAFSSGFGAVDVNLAGTGDSVFASLFGLSQSSPGTTGRLFADMAFNLTNTSATETFTLDFGFLVSKEASATGPDAFTYNDLSVIAGLPGSGATEVFYSRIVADTVNGNQDDEGTGPYTVTLAPGATLDFSALLTHEGGTFGATGSYRGSIGVTISLLDVRSSGGGGGGNNGVPLPGTLALVLLGLPLVRAARRRLV